MAQMRIAGRDLRRGTINTRRVCYRPKAGGKVFELKREDVQPQSILTALDHLLEDIP